MSYNVFRNISEHIVSYQFNIHEVFCVFSIYIVGITEGLWIMETGVTFSLECLQ